MHSRRALAAILASSLALGCQSTPTQPPASAAAPSSSVETKETFYARGRAEVDFNARIQPNKRKAKNVILFLGDGMGVTTITAARILDGQMKGMKFGEENDLSFEKFPHLAHSKTYQANQQTPDSAPTMTSIVTGSKANDGMLSVAPNVIGPDPIAAAKPENRLTTILERAEEHGMWTGVISTARLTHATPAACYSHTPFRDWESDADLSPKAAEVDYPDIARQLLDFHVRDTTLNGKTSRGLEVAMGGGRSNFLTAADPDPEDQDAKGKRKSRNLVNEWTGRGGAFVYDQKGFDAIDPAKTGPVLGLFERGHMEFELDRSKDTAGEPSLTQMMEKAVRVLQRSPKGFFLMVEGGRIDHAHHGGNAKRALLETIELSRAVQRATELVGDDTLIIVTADHSHTFSMVGYPTRGNPILGLVVTNDDATGLPATAPSKGKDGKPYTTLGYMNGPGAVAGERADLSAVDTTADNYLQQALVPMDSESHGGEDVVIYARGPQAYLVEGTMEENAIYFVMARALGFEGGKR
ncbi:MAG TPA: alkaline phosphatase [Thermoanaerobaculia bacterium]|jgi:alkaline phosphatase|nr:alkaline phosphatase [Thermoanaerobaculia bacterium]